MSFIHSSIFYVRFKVLFQLIYLNCFKHFSVRRFLTTLLFVIILLIYWTLIFVFRLLDEILFFGYRKTEIKNPVFIISNPRSGTTYMHRLMCLDEDRFSYTLLYHTILPSITFIKIIQALGWVDQRIGRPGRRFFDWLDKVAFGGWSDVHPMGFNKSEEDEGMYFFLMFSPALGLVCPFFDVFKDIQFPDKLDRKDRQPLMNFYVNTVKRWMYCMGKDKVYLAKSVMSTGRLRMLLEEFPDARIIYLIRTPMKAVPSFASMFTAPWKLISPDLPLNGKEGKSWCDLAIAYYAYFYEQKNLIDPENFKTIRYTDLVKHPRDTVISIYKHFGIEITPNFQEQLEKITVRNRNYKSKHSYSLEEYGMTPEEVYEPLKDLFEEFEFNPNPN